MSEKHPVTAIANGTVIDHIPKGRSLTVLTFLNIHPEEKTVLLGMNLSSRHFGYKDLIKLTDITLNQEQIDGIAIFAPDASINTVENYKVVNKTKAKLPEQIKKLLICPNKQCITRVEPVETDFSVELYKNEVWLHCKYCESMYPRQDVNEYNL